MDTWEKAFQFIMILDFSQYGWREMYCAIVTFFQEVLLVLVILLPTNRHCSLREEISVKIHLNGFESFWKICFFFIGDHLAWLFFLRSTADLTLM